MSDYTQLLAELAQWQERIKLGGNHRYTVDGKYRPGVTTIIKTLDAPRLDDWKVRVQVEGTARAAYSNPPYPEETIESYIERLKKLGAAEYEHQRLSDQAAKVGTDVHALIQHAVKTMLGQETVAPEVCEEALFRFAGWREWAKDKGLKPLASEARVFNAEDGYCGTLDLLAVVDGQPAVIDFKPTPAVYPERRMQLAAYREALMNMSGWPVGCSYINCLPREGGAIEMIPVEEENSYAAFLACRRLHAWLAVGERKSRKVA